MSGASALAAAKRRRTHNVPDVYPLNNSKAISSENTNGGQKNAQQGQPPHPVAILRAHELRLNQVDKNQSVIDESLELFAQEISNVKELPNEINNIRTQISELKNMLYKLQNMVITANLSNTPNLSNTSNTSNLKNTKSKTVKGLDIKESNEDNK